MGLRFTGFKNGAGTGCQSCGGSGCVVKFCVTGCPAGNPIAATITVRDSSGSTVGNCAATVSGGTSCCTTGIPSAGNYSVSVSAPGYQPWTATIPLACNQTVDVKLLPTTAPATIVFTVYGCNFEALAGATITLSDGQSCTTDASGQCSFWIAKGGTYTFTASKARFNSYSDSITIGDCSTTGMNQGVNLSPASGYVCCSPCGISLADPIPTTLNLTDSKYGSTTLTWNGTVWAGTLSGLTAHPAPGVPAGACPDPSTFSMHYTFCGTPYLSMEWRIRACGSCFGNAFSTSGGAASGMPSDPIPDPCAPGSSLAPILNWTADGAGGFPGAGTNSADSFACTADPTIPLNATVTYTNGTGDMSVGGMTYQGDATWTITE